MEVLDITGTVRKFAAEGGDGVTVSIWKNGFMLWPETGQWKPIAYNDTVRAAKRLLQRM